MPGKVVPECVRWSLIFAIFFKNIEMKTYCDRLNAIDGGNSLTLSTSTASRIRGAYLQCGDVYERGKRPGSSKKARSDKKVTAAVLKFVLHELRKNPSLRLTEMSNLTWAQFDSRVSKSTICVALHEAGWSFQDIQYISGRISMEQLGVFHNNVSAAVALFG